MPRDNRRLLPCEPTYPMSADSVFRSFSLTVAFHCWSLGIRYSDVATRSESWEVGVRGMKPRVVAGNGCRNVENPLLASALVKPWANGAEVNNGAEDAFPLNGGAW